MLFNEITLYANIAKNQYNLSVKKIKSNHTYALNTSMVLFFTL